MIAILDYGAGNLRSVQNTLDEIGASYRVVRDAAGLAAAPKIILPGVGHFGQMMRALDDLRVRSALVDRIGSGVPFLGICLGLHAFYQGSTEAPEEKGLGIFPGTVERFHADARVPHMGWNSLVPTKPSKLLRNLGTDPYVYFAHSYFVPPNEQTAAITEYTVPYTSVIEWENVYGVQFHPEKSGPVGLAIVRNFVELA
ncbi:MAG TPA: imidazole glycerol phosphate synthase subunit HisH [Bryobacteraceae bacterium]|nr:imidazole glycerol phosphate synthase subunit HisH [Bryobacteraceae bacterium]